MLRTVRSRIRHAHRILRREKFLLRFYRKVQHPPYFFASLDYIVSTLHFTGDDSKFPVLILVGLFVGVGLRQKGSSH